MAAAPVVAEGNGAGRQLHVAAGQSAGGDAGNGGELRGALCSGGTTTAAADAAAARLCGGGERSDGARGLSLYRQGGEVSGGVEEGQGGVPGRDSTAAAESAMLGTLSRARRRGGWKLGRGLARCWAGRVGEAEQFF